MRLTVNAPPPPADPRDLASSFEDAPDDFADDLDTGEMVTSGLADPPPGPRADDGVVRRRRAGIDP
ncbi:MAG: hypothetical protein R3F59_10125 [Myxococcota bacterium]